MVSDPEKIERRLTLNFIAEVIDCFPLGVAIGIVRRGPRSDGKRVERQHGMQVQVAKVDIPERILRQRSLSLRPSDAVQQCHA